MVLSHSSYISNLCLLAIDGQHLVSEWRDFRPEYFNGRTRLPDGIPFLGERWMKTLNSVRSQCGFRDETRLIKTPLDRPKIYIQVSSLLKSQAEMLDLQQFCFRLSSGNKGLREFPLFDVLYVPDGGLNLISQGQLQRDGCPLKIVPEGIEIGNYGITARRQDNNLYILNVRW